jgi:hypothetical protein
MSWAKYRVYPLVKSIYVAISVYTYVAYNSGVPGTYIYIHRVYPILTTHQKRL